MRKFHIPKACQRCKIPSDGMIMSMFNEDWICFSCHKIEQNHPNYKDAVEAERAAILDGNYNFKGIGKPHDL